MNLSTKTQRFDPFGGHSFTPVIRKQLNGRSRFKEGRFILREFPDGEAYIKINSDVIERIITCNTVSHSTNRNKEWL